MKCQFFYFILINKIICQSKRLMFSMTSLESENSPLRTFQTFYKPRNRPHEKSIKKTFHQYLKDPEIQQMYNPNSKDISTKKYLDVLLKNKSLQRRPINREQFYSYISFRRGQNSQNNSLHRVQNSQQSDSIFSKQKSISSIKFSTIGTSRTQSLCSILDKKRKYSLKNQLLTFQKKLSQRQQETKDRLRFTFYTNNQKSKYILDKYQKDQNLDQRKTNLYQNVFNRKIVQDSLLELLGQVDKKRRKGEIV